MAGTPTSKILDTIALAEKMQVQIDHLIADVDALSTRVEGLEKTLAGMSAPKARRR